MLRAVGLPIGADRYRFFCEIIKKIYEFESIFMLEMLEYGPKVSVLCDGITWMLEIDEVASLCISDLAEIINY